MRADRYRVSFIARPGNLDPMLTIDCQDCETTLFQWTSTNSFGLPFLIGAVVNHETGWHTDKPAN
jgi:hypothetical protein